MAKFTDFVRGYQMGRQMVLDSRAEAERQEMAKIGQATPEESEGFTAEQGEQLRAAADSGQYDIGFDQAKGAYTVQPKAGGMAGLIAHQGVTDFLGERVAGSMSDRQVNDAREQAMAGVLMRSNPIAGMRMQRDLVQGQREDSRYEREQKRWGREDAEQSKADDYEAGRQQIFNESLFGSQQVEYVTQLKGWREAAKKYEEQLARGIPEAQLGPRPQQPTRPAYTVAQSLADQASLLAHDSRFGKLSTQAFGEFTERLRKVSDEGYEAALRAAASGAPLDAIAKRFNESGAMRFDPKAVVSDQVVTRPDGVKSRVLRLRDADGKEMSIDTVAELDALGKANEIFARHFRNEDNRRANNADRRGDAQLQLSVNADRRASASAGRTVADGRARSEAAVAIYREQNPDATPAQIEAVRRGVIDAVPQTGKSAPAEVKLAEAALAAKVPGVTDMASALQWARTSRDKSPSEIRAEIFKEATKRTYNVAEARAATDEAMRYLYPEQAAPQSGKAAQPRGASKPSSQSDAHRQAQAAISAGADRNAVNARLRELGFEPLGAR